MTKADTQDSDWVWVFQGENSPLANAVFTDKNKAEKWIQQYQLSGLLTRMPLNQSIYDWAVESGRFTPKQEYQTTGKFMQRFTSAFLPHEHYLEGVSSEE